MKQGFLCSIIVFFISTTLFSQSRTCYFSTLIIDQTKNEPIPFAAVQITNLEIGSTANNNGKTLPIQLNKGKYDLQISCLGYNTTTVSFTLQSDTTFIIPLLSNQITINEVLVTATESANAVTSSKINRNALEHIQASSFSDVLQLMPGGKSSAPNLSEVNSISLRQAGTDINTALGTSFIIDGAPVSNDANMLSPNYTISDAKLDNRLNVNNGMDMRSIPTDQIESIEVIQGIPSVLHGDLTSGAIIIKQRHGITPWQARLKTDTRNKLFSLGKGLSLGQNFGSLNVNGDYVIFNSDPRNPYEGYQRYTFSSRYFNTLQFSNSSLVINGNVSYTGSAEKDRNDPEVDDQANDKYSTNYNRYAYSISAEWNLNSWFRQLTFSSSGSYSGNKLYRQKFISNGGAMPAPTNIEEGESYGIYLPASYEAQYGIEDKPVNLFNRIVGHLSLPIGSVSNAISIGAEWKLDVNHGKGEIYSLERPMYQSFSGSYSTSSRPRDHSTIPSIQKFAIFLEEKIKMDIGTHQLDAQLGIRASRLLNLSDDYDLQGKIYFEPRLNLLYSLPTFNLGKHKVNLSFNGGIGEHYKFPTLNQLYPAPFYFDMVQMNYFSQTAELRNLHIKTKIVDPTNYELDIASNLKWEFGVNVKVNQHRLNVTYFDEKMENGYLTQKQWTSNQYKLYNTDDLNPTEPPLVDNLNYTEQNILGLYGQTHNGAGVNKKGIEYQLAFDRFDKIYTRLTINGAWFNTAYRTLTETIYQPSIVLNGEAFPYAGIYTWNKSTDVDREQFNTNFQFDTQVKQLGIIFTSTLECNWFTSQRKIPNSGWPSSYVDAYGNIHTFNEQDKNDPYLSQLYYGQSDEYYHKLTEPFGMNLNIRVSKTFTRGFNLSFYVNNLLNYYPDYYNNYGSRVQRITHPYFGMELNLSL